MRKEALQGRAEMRRMYRRHGLELVEPFYDRRLIEFALAIPADQWGRPGRTRWVLRNAMKGRLPDQVVERKSKTSFSALWERGLRDRAREEIITLLAHPEIVRRRFVDSTWLRREVDAGTKLTDGGYALWRCVSLELWLSRAW